MAILVNLLTKYKKAIFGVIAAALLLPGVALAARTSIDWVNLSGTTYIQPNYPSGMDLLIFGSNHYINFNTVTGSSGYGLRDNAGTMEFKNSGGSWTGIGTGGSGSPGGTTGQLQYNGAGGVFAGVSTTTASCSGSASCSPFVIIGSSPVTISASGSGGSGLATTSPIVSSNLLVYSTSGAGSAYGVSTSTLTASSPLTGSFTTVGASGSLGCQTASNLQAGCLALADFSNFNNRLSTTTSLILANEGLYFSTTSNNYWLTQQVIPSFSTTSASYFSGAGLAFSTTSNNYYTNAGFAFSTTSNNAWSAAGLAFSTTSASYFSSLGLAFSTTSDLYAFQTELAATTSVKSIATLPTLSLPYTQITGVPAFDTFAYPFPNNATTSSLTLGGATTTGTLYVTSSTTLGSTLSGAGLSTCNGSNFLQWTAGVIGCATAGGSSNVGNWFTPTTNYGATANATNTPIWLQAGLQASSSINVLGNITSSGKNTASQFISTSSGITTPNIGFTFSGDTTTGIGAGASTGGLSFYGQGNAHFQISSLGPGSSYSFGPSFTSSNGPELLDTNGSDAVPSLYFTGSGYGLWYDGSLEFSGGSSRLATFGTGGDTFPVPLIVNAGKLSTLGGGFLSTASSTVNSTLTLSPLATPAGTFIAADPTGKLIATSTPAGVAGVNVTFPITTTGGLTPTIGYVGLTSSTPWTAGQIAEVTGDGKTLIGAATTTASCAGTNSCSSFTVLGSTPVTITGSASGGSGQSPFSWVVAPSGGDFTTIQAALDRCGALGGGNIILTAPLYVQGGTGLLWKGSNCSIEGRGAGTTTISFTGVTTGIKTNSPSSQYTNDQLHHLEFLGNATAGSIAVDWSDMTHGIVDDVQGINMGEFLHLNDTQNVTFYNSFTNLEASTSQFCINASSTNPVNANYFNNIFCGDQVANWTGVQINNANGNYFNLIYTEPTVGIAGSTGLKIFDNKLATNNGVFNNTLSTWYIEGNITGVSGVDTVNPAAGGIQRNTLTNMSVESNTTDWSITKGFIALNNFICGYDSNFGPCLTSFAGPFGIGTSSELQSISNTPNAMLAVNGSSTKALNTVLIGLNQSTFLRIDNSGNIFLPLLISQTCLGTSATGQIQAGTCSGGGAAYPFTPGTFGSTLTSATSTAINDSQGFMASTTSWFTGLTSTITAGANTAAAFVVNSSGLPLALTASDATNFANSSSLVRFSQVNSTDSGAALELSNLGTGNTLLVDQGTSTLNGSLVDKTTSGTAFQVLDAFNGTAMRVGTASTTGPILIVQATSTTDTLFSVDQYGHLLASSTPNTITLGTCTGGATITAGSNDVTGDITLTTAVTSCAVVFSRPYTVIPEVFLTGAGTVSFPAVTARSTTGFTISVGAAVTGDDISYFVVQP